MRIFLDTSVVLAACRSSTGASRKIFVLSVLNGWTLIATPYVVEEVEENLPHMGSDAGLTWPALKAAIQFTQTELTLNRPYVYSVTKDKPILFSALASSEVLLTLDARDFGDLIGNRFYELEVLSPGELIARERSTGLIE